MNWSAKQSSGVNTVEKSLSESPSILKLVMKFAPAEEFRREGEEEKTDAISAGFVKCS